MPEKGSGLAAEYSKRYGKPFDELLKDWYWNHGMSQSDIAEKIGTNTSYMSRLFKRYKIPKRKKNYWCYGAPALYQVKIGGNTHDVTGTTKTPKGYITLCIPDHPNSGKDRRVFEHRVIKEIELGRYLEDDEIVHHKNEIKDDNRPENLEVMSTGEHSTYHNQRWERSEETKEKMKKAAEQRFKNKKNHPYYKDIDREVTSMLEEGVSVTDISKELKVTRKTIYNKINYLGLKEMLKNAQ